MKLRIAGNSIRLRLSQSDVRLLADTGSVAETVDIGPNQRLSYRLIRSDSAERMTAGFEDNCLTVFVPARLTDKWTATAEVGIQTDPSERLKILVEKDFACLHPHPGEDDQDTFPNPAGA